MKGFIYPYLSWKVFRPWNRSYPGRASPGPIRALFTAGSGLDTPGAGTSVHRSRIKRFNPLFSQNKPLKRSENLLFIGLPGGGHYEGVLSIDHKGDRPRERVCGGPLYIDGGWTSGPIWSGRTGTSLILIQEEFNFFILYRDAGEKIWRPGPTVCGFSEPGDKLP